MRNIKLGIIAAMSYPPKKASGIRVKNEIQAILAYDDSIKIYLFCCPPGDKTEIKENLLIFRTKNNLNTDDYFKYYKWKNKILIDIELAIQVAKKIRSKEVNIVHAHTMEGVFISLLSRIIAFKNIPVIADLHGPFLPEIIHYKMIPNNKRLLLLFSFAERILLISTKKILVTSIGLANYYKKTVKKSKVEVISDYVLLSAINRRKIKNDSKKLLKDVNPDNKIIIMYAGTLKDYQGIDILIKAAKNILKVEKRILFVVVGGGGLGVNFFKTLAKKNNLGENIIFTGMVSHADVFSYLSLADILVSPRKKTDVTKYGFVSQIPEYMALGKTIIATDISDCRLMLKQHSGILVKANSVNDLVLKIVETINKNDKRYAKNALTMVTKFSWEFNTHRLIKIYEDLI